MTQEQISDLELMGLWKVAILEDHLAYLDHLLFINFAFSLMIIYINKFYKLIYYITCICKNLCVFNSISNLFILRPWMRRGLALWPWAPSPSSCAAMAPRPRSSRATRAK